MHSLWLALLSAMTVVVPPLRAQERVECDLLDVGGNESGVAAAVQACRLGVKKVILVNDIDWLGGQFSSEGVGAIDEWTTVLPPDHPAFVPANLLSVQGSWQPDVDSVFFQPEKRLEENAWRNLLGRVPPEIRKRLAPDVPATRAAAVQSIAAAMKVR